MNQIFINIGPHEGFTTGQQFISKYVSSLIVDRQVVNISTGGTGLPFFVLICRFFSGAYRLLFECWRNYDNEIVVYLSLSRSWMGLCKESYVALFHGIFKFPLIIHWHGAEPLHWRRGKHWALSRLMLFFWGRAKLHIALTNDMAEDLRSLGYERVVVLKNFSNLDIINSDRVASATNKKVKFLFLSNLIPGKGLEDAIFSLEGIGDDVISLDVVGANITRQSHKYLSAMSECKFVSYKGAIEGEAKRRILLQCDVLLFPSTYRTEALPLVVIEAIHSGLAVLAYDHNYMSEFANLKGVELIPPDKFELRKAVHNIIHNRSKIKKMQTENIKSSFSYSRANFDACLVKLINECY